MRNEFVRGEGVTVRDSIRWPFRRAARGCYGGQKAIFVLAICVKSSLSWAGDVPECPAIMRIVSNRDFVLHTDLSNEHADAVLTRMQMTLNRAADYWNRPLKGRIECFVIDQPDKFGEDDFPDREAVYLLRRIGGGTRAVPLRRTGARRIRARVYATTHLDVVEHEVIHAYCLQTFGTTGPCWYREGMAQYGSYLHDDKQDDFPTQMTDYLLSCRILNVAQIVKENNFTDLLSQSIQTTSRRPAEEGGPTGIELLGESPELDAASRGDIQHGYWKAWALCHFLEQHPHYHERFRMLGDCYLIHHHDGFERIFGANTDEVTREFQEFVASLSK